MILYYLFGSFSPLLLIVLVVLCIRAIYSNSQLSHRVDVLETKIKSLSGGVKTPEGKLVVPDSMMKEVSEYATANNVKLDQISQSIPSTVSDISLDQKPSRFSVWIKEDWLMKLGALLFIMGFGWFVSYAFANNWIGPIGRISIGIVAGVGIMAFGFRWMMKYVTQGSLFMALGAGMAILTIFAGRSIYNFFTPSTAVLFDFIIVSFVAFASYRFNTKSLAFIAQVLAFLTPLLVAGQSNSVFLFTYLLLISVATLFLASVTGWRELITSSLIFVGMYSAPFIGGTSLMYRNDAPLILNFAYVFSLLYLFSGMTAVVMKGVQDAKNEIFLAVLNGAFLFVWIYNTSIPEWHVMIYSVWAMIFIISSFVALKFSKEVAPFYAYGSVAIAFLAAATAAQLDGAALTIAFTLEVFLLVMNVLWLTNDVSAASTTSWLFLAPVALSLQSLSAYSHSLDILSADFFVLVLLAVCLILVGRYIIQDGGNKDSGEVKFGSMFVVLGIAYLMYVVWQLVHIFLYTTPDMASMVALFVFTLAGVTAYFTGLQGGDMARRTYGVMMIGFVVVRLLLVDVWNMELFGRVVTFLAIGVLLMSTAFLTKKQKHD